MGYSFSDSGWHHPEASGAANRYEPRETVQESGSEKSQAPVTHAIDSGRITGNPEVIHLAEKRFPEKCAGEYTQKKCAITVTQNLLLLPKLTSLTDRIY
jgi:hypothetical protein